MPDLQEPDPRAPRWGVLLVCSGTLVGVLVLWLVRQAGPAARAWLLRDADQIGPRVELALAAITLVTVGPILGLGAYFWWAGGRIVRAERFPAPGSFVMRQTVVLRGTAARRRGRIIQLLGGLLVAAASAFTLILWRLRSMLDLPPQ